MTELDGRSHLVEPGSRDDTRLVTFVYRGEDADLAYLIANRLSDPKDPHDTRLELMPGTDLAFLTVEMPDDWIATYSVVTPPEPLRSAPLHQPLALRDRQALGSHTRATGVVDLERAPALPPRGTVEAWQREDHRVVGPASGEDLPLTLMSHPEATVDSPVVVMLDGEVWLRDHVVIEALDHAVTTGEAPPMTVALLHAAGPRSRQLDYACEPGESAALLDRITAELPGPRRSAPWIIAGSSLGGLFALLCATRHPDRIGSVVAQSPSLWWPTDDPLAPGPGRWFEEFAAQGHGAPAVVQVGQLETTLAHTVLHARELLRSHGLLIETPHDVVRGGHDMAWWRRTLPPALIRAANSTGRVSS